MRTLQTLKYHSRNFYFFQHIEIDNVAEKLQIELVDFKCDSHGEA